MDNFDYKKYLAEGKLLKESAPGYDTRKQGEALPTLESVKAAYEAKMNIKEDEDYDTGGLENQIKQWVNNNAGGYGPDEDDENSFKFKDEMKTLLDNTLEDFNPDYYGDDTTMSPDDILEDFIDGAIDIIGKYTVSGGYYGDSTSFSPDDIKDEFYEFIGVDPITESNILD